MCATEVTWAWRVAPRSPKSSFSSMSESSLPTLPVCVCIQFPLALFHLPAFRKRHIYLYNLSNIRYDVACVVWKNLSVLFEAEGRARNFIINSLLCPLWNLKKWFGKRTQSLDTNGCMSLLKHFVLGYFLIFQNNQVMFRCHEQRIRETFDLTWQSNLCQSLQIHKNPKRKKAVTALPRMRF